MHDYFLLILCCHYFCTVLIILHDVDQPNCYAIQTGSQGLALKEGYDVRMRFAASVP